MVEKRNVAAFLADTQRAFGADFYFTSAMCRRTWPASCRAGELVTTSPCPMYESYPKLGLRLSDLFLAESRMQFSFDAYKASVVVTGQKHRSRVPAWGAEGALDHGWVAARGHGGDRR